MWYDMICLWLNQFMSLIVDLFGASQTLISKLYDILIYNGYG